MHEFDDLQGSVRTLEQRSDERRRIPELSHLPDPQSFDVEFSSSRLVISVTTLKRDGRVHHSEHYLYDSIGKVTRSMRKDAAGVETESTEFSLEFDGKRAWATHNVDGQTIATGTDEYSSGLLVRMTSFRGETWCTRRTIEYVERKPVKRISEFYGFNGELLETSITRFDSDGRVAETFGLKADGRPLGDGRYVYEYDAAGRKHRVLSFNDLADENVPNHIRGFTYVCDDVGNWIERREYSRFRGDDRSRESVTTRKVTYYS